MFKTNLKKHCFFSLFFSRGAYVTTVYICINYDNLLFSDFDMPRIKDPIWKKFNEIQLANGSTRGECPICKVTVVGLVSRLKAHYEACSRKRSNNEEIEVLEPNTPKQAKLPFLSGGAKEHDIELQLTRYL